MTSVTDLVDQHATRMADQQMADIAIQANPSVLSALQQFETDAPDVDRLVFGGILAQNAVTERLQSALGITPEDGVFGSGTAASVLQILDDNDIDLSEFSHLNSLIQNEYPELHDEYTADLAQETAQSKETRAEIYDGLSSELSQAFTNARAAVLERYYNHDELRSEIDTLIEEGVGRREITERMTKHYEDILDALPSAIADEVREMVELDGVDVDDFVQQQIDEVFRAIDLETIQKELQDQLRELEEFQRNNPSGLNPTIPV